MPFDVSQATDRLRHLHGDALAFRRALLDVAFAAGCPVSEQAVALEHGDAVTLRMASPGTAADRPALRLAVLDLDPPGRAGQWSAELDSLGGPALAQTWAVALHALVRTAGAEPWELLYTRGPAIGVPGYVRERLAATAATIQLVACPSQPTRGEPLDGVALTLRRAENLWRLPACDWTAALSVGGPDALLHLRTWLQTLAGAWTLHDLAQRSAGPLTAVLRAEQPLTPPPGIALRELNAPPRLAFPVNDALLAWPRAWLPQPTAVQTLPDGLWLAGLTPPVMDDAALPAHSGALTLEWLIEPVARSAAGQVLIAVSAAEALGPVAAGLEGPIWRLPGASEVELAVRGLSARLAGQFTAQRA